MCRVPKKVADRGLGGGGGGPLVHGKWETTDLLPENGDTRGGNLWGRERGSYDHDGPNNLPGGSKQ